MRLSSTSHSRESDTKVSHQHPSPVLQLPVFLTVLSPWEQACFSPLLSWSYKTLLKAHCSTPAVWWHRTSAFKKATVLKKARAIPSKKKGFAKQEITQVRLLFSNQRHEKCWNCNSNRLKHFRITTVWSSEALKKGWWLGFQKPKT